MTGRIRGAGPRARLRRLAMGLGTATGLSPRGFFIPYRFAGRLPARAASYPGLAAQFEARRPAFARCLDAIETHARELEAIGGAAPPAPRWDQDWFPRLDAAAAYALLRRLRPRRVIEVGSGHSTRFLVRAARDGGFDPGVVCFDPAPRARLDRLGVEHRPRMIEADDAPLFAALEADDVAFVDSSHILMPGTDVDILLNHVWPVLRAGVVLHVHDVFLPDDYPSAWRWRGYNEQLGVAPLIAAAAAELLFASHYVATRMAGRVATGVLGRLPLPAGAVESSLWLRKRVPAAA